MHVLHFASQPASFNQVHQTLVQLAIMQGNPITMGEYDNQPNIWLNTNPTHTSTLETNRHTVQTHIRGHIYSNTHAPTHPHAQVSTSSHRAIKHLKTHRHGYMLLEN